MEQLNSRLTDGILHLELNVPGKKNALTDVLRAELRSAVSAAQDNPDVRALVLSGAGGSFCSGGDITAMTSDAEAARARMSILHDVVRLLLNGRLPSVAAVNGSAFGAGFSLALCCDQVIVGPSARFCASFCRIGLPPDLALGFTLPRRTGDGCARRLLLSGEVVDSEAALSSGIADERTDDESGLIALAMARARALSAYGPATKKHVKQALSQNSGDLEAALAREMESYLTLLASDEHLEARHAFLSARR